MVKRTTVEDEQTFDVEAIIGYRRILETMEFYVKWQNYPYTDNTWEPLNHLRTVWPLIIEYLLDENMEALVPEVKQFLGLVDAEKKTKSNGTKVDVQKKTMEDEENDVTNTRKWSPPVCFVDKVISHKYQNGELTFLISWQNDNPSANNTWEGLNNISLRTAMPLLHDYLNVQNLQSLIPVVNRAYNDPRSRGLAESVFKIDVESHMKKNIKKDSEKVKEKVAKKDTKKVVKENAKVDAKLDANKEVKLEVMAKNAKKESEKDVKKTTKKDDPIYFVESVTAHRRRHKKLQFLIKWKDYDAKDNTWEGLDNLRTANPLVYNYLEQLGLHDLIDEVKGFYGDA